MKTVRHAELAASEEFFKKIQNTTQDSAAAYAQLPHSCFKHQVSPFLFEVVGSSEWAFIHPSALVPSLSSHSLSTKHLLTWSTTPPHSLRSPLCPQGPGGRVCNVILAPQPMGSLTHMFHHWKHHFHFYQRVMDLLPSFFFSKVHLHPEFPYRYQSCLHASIFSRHFASLPAGGAASASLLSVTHLNSIFHASTLFIGVPGTRRKTRRDTGLWKLSLLLYSFYPFLRLCSATAGIFPHKLPWIWSCPHPPEFLLAHFFLFAFLLFLRQDFTI